MFRFVVFVVILATIHSVQKADAGLIVPVSASGTGSFSNSPSKLIDGVLPPRFTGWLDPTNVFWIGDATQFTINLGNVYLVENLIVDVDNNDDYVVASSIDGVNFTKLFTFLTSDGFVNGGMDLLTTDKSYPANPGDNTTAAYVGRGFQPTMARFLRISGQAGDGRYAIGEIQAYGVQAVPEPAGLTSLVAGILAFLTFLCSKFTSQKIFRAFPGDRSHLVKVGQPCPGLVEQCSGIVRTMNSCWVFQPSGAIGGVR